MAFITERVASFASGQVVCEVNFQSQNLSISKGRIINNSDAPAEITAKETATGDSWTMLGPAQETRQVNFPNNKYYMKEDPAEPGNYNLDGINIFARWPA